MDDTADSSASGRMSLMDIVAPREASRCAVASPIPDAAPEMVITFPEREVMVGMGMGDGDGVGGGGLSRIRLKRREEKKNEVSRGTYEKSFFDAKYPRYIRPP